MRLSLFTLGFIVIATMCTPAAPKTGLTADDQRAVGAVDSAFVAAWLRRTDSLTFTYAKAGTTNSLTSRSMSLAVLRRQPDGAWRFSRVMWGARK